jgi:hypothetical protein
MGKMHFNENDLDQIVSCDLTLEQCVTLLSILDFLVQSGLSDKETDLYEIYVNIFDVISPFGTIQDDMEI